MVGTRRNKLQGVGRGNDEAISGALRQESPEQMEDSYSTLRSNRGQLDNVTGNDGPARARQSERSIARQARMEEQLRAQEAEIARMERELRDAGLRRDEEGIRGNKEESMTGRVSHPATTQNGPRNAGRRSSSFKSFMDCKPPVFKGGEDPQICLKWLRKIEQVFRTGNYTEQQKVSFAILRFENEALDWWDTMDALLTEATRDNITWAVFAEKVKTRFCSREAMERPKREFLELKKGSMTIAKYNVTFTKKLLCAGYYCATEEDQIERYVEGLPYEYQVAVRMQKTLGEAMDEASRVEYDLTKRDREISKEGEKRKWEGPSGSSKKMNQERKDYESQGKASYCETCHSTHSGPCNVNTRRCCRRGQKGQMYQDCKSTEKICYNCREIGHMISNFV